MKAGKPSLPASRGSSALAAVTLCAAICIWAVPALPAGSPAGSKDKPDEFRNGILAERAKDWKQSARLMRMAHEKLPEDGARARVGSRFVPYLPLYHLGLSLYRQNRCPDALKAWKESLDLGVVTSFPIELELLTQYKKACLDQQYAPGSAQGRR